MDAFEEQYADFMCTSTHSSVDVLAEYKPRVVRVTMKFLVQMCSKQFPEVTCSIEFLLQSAGRTPICSCRLCGRNIHFFCNPLYFLTYFGERRDVITFSGFYVGVSIKFLLVSRVCPAYFLSNTDPHAQYVTTTSQNVSLEGSTLSGNIL
jgi:hypothetical protein